MSPQWFHDTNRILVVPKPGAWPSGLLLSSLNWANYLEYHHIEKLFEIFDHLMHCCPLWTEPTISNIIIHIIIFKYHLKYLTIRFIVVIFEPLKRKYFAPTMQWYTWYARKSTDETLYSSTLWMRMQYKMPAAQFKRQDLIFLIRPNEGEIF